MDVTVTNGQYRALAELRYRIRHFTRDGDAAAQRSGWSRSNI